MKNLKVVLSAALVMATAGTYAMALDIDLSKIKVDGTLEMKAQSASNESDYSNSANDERNSTRHRVTLGLGGELTEGIKVRVEAVRRPLTSNGFLGTANPSTAGQFGQGAQSVQNELDSWIFQQAFMHIEDLFFGVGVKAGRQSVGSANSHVYFAGAYDDDSLTVTGVDAINLMKKAGPVDLAYMHATTNDVKTLAGSDYSGATGRSVFRSLSANANLKELSGNDMLDVPLMLAWHHGEAQGVTNAVTDNVNLGTYELSADLNLMEGMLGFGFDYASNSGQRNVTATPDTKVNFKGTLTALNAKFNHAETGFSAWGNLVTASGDDDATEPGAASVDDKSWHDYSAFGLAPKMNLGEILGKSTLGAAFPATQSFDTGTPLAAGQGRGLKVTNLGAGYTLPVMDKAFMVSADYIMASAAKLFTADTQSKSKDIGTELDLALSYKKSDNLGFKVGYATFDPEAQSIVLGTPNETDPVTKLFANASVKF